MQVQAQTYTVLKVSPANSAKAQGKIIKVGTKLNKNTQITFTQKNAYLRVFDGKKSATINRAGILSSVLQAPRKVNTNTVLATRNLLNNKQDLENWIQTPNLLVIDQMSVYIPASVFKLSVWTEDEDPENEFFFISYQYQGEEINKYLKVEKPNNFVLDANMYQVAGQMIDTSQMREMKLRYALDAYTDYIAGKNLSLRFVKTADIKTEIKTLLMVTKEKDKEALQKLVHTYLIQHYGNPESENLKKWLEKEFPKWF